MSNENEHGLRRDELAEALRRQPLIKRPLGDAPLVAFAPNYQGENETQSIVTVKEGEGGYRPTDLTAPNLREALALCGDLNDRLGIGPDEAERLVAASMGKRPEGL